MRKERNIQRKKWTDLRAEIAKTIADNGLLETDFRPLSVHENWQQIEDNIYNTFCSMTNAVQRQDRLWTHFKLDTFSLAASETRPESYLSSLVDAAETVWYAVNETINERTKFWFYEGKIKSIQKIIEETWFDELYIISKKYEWLLCINHHDNLIATGTNMPDKLRTVQKTTKQWS